MKEAGTMSWRARLEISPFAPLSRYDNRERTQSIWQSGTSPVDMITKCKHIYAPVYYELCAFSRDSYSCVTFCRLFVTAQRISAPRTSFCIHLCHILAKICHSSPSQTEILSLVLEKAPLQELAAEKTSLVLGMAPLQGLEVGKLGLILETAPL